MKLGQIHCADLYNGPSLIKDTLGRRPSLSRKDPNLRSKYTMNAFHPLSHQMTPLS